MKLTLASLTTEQFLAEYWQQKPIVIKGGIENFTNPLDAETLAGLAAETNIESRLIYRQENAWQAQSGPFDNYEAYGEKNWTLVVQSVNHWIPAAQKLACLFDFIPQWRFDDVMVSFAATGGGVGPHVDNYDVFICQGSGQRRWKIGAKNAAKTLISHEKLLHVEPFTPIIDTIVSAGDIVYIPPGFPHEGVSLDKSMSFSVGYKSTNATELLSGFADYLIDFDPKPMLLSDKQRQSSRYGQINQADFQRLQHFLAATVKDEGKLADFLGIQYSQSTSELDLAADDYTFEQWLAAFSQQPLQKLYAVKSLYLEQTIDQGCFYFDGERQQIADISADLIRLICDAQQLKISDISRYDNHEAALHWLWQSTNRGYWFFKDSLRLQ